MKTIVSKVDKLSKYVFGDDANVLPMQDHVQCPDFIIADMNFFTCDVVENVTPPEDWAGNKYFWKNNNWELNPDWVEPPTMEEEAAA